MRAQLCIVAASVVLVTSCSSNPAPSSGTQAVPSRSRSANVITSAELNDPIFAGNNALLVIRKLRPGYFMPRPVQTLDAGASSGLLQISHDYGPLQPVSTLEMLNTKDFIEVRYLAPNDAQARFGLNANGGPVIVLVATKGSY